MHTKEIEITKSSRGWSVHTIQHWDDWPNPVSTHSGASTLAWAIYKAVSRASETNTQVVKLTVKGEPYPREKVEASIRKSCAGMLSYTLEDTLATLAL